MQHQSLDHRRVERNAIPRILGLHVPDPAVNHAPLNQQRESKKIEIPPLKRNDLADAQAQAPSNQHHCPVRLPDQRQQRMELLRSKDPRRFEALASHPSPEPA